MKARIIPPEDGWKSNMHYVVKVNGSVSPAAPAKSNRRSAPVA